MRTRRREKMDPDRLGGANGRTELLEPSLISYLSTKPGGEHWRGNQHLREYVEREDRERKLRLNRSASRNGMRAPGGGGGGGSAGADDADDEYAQSVYRASGVLMNPAPWVMPLPGSAANPQPRHPFPVANPFSGPPPGMSACGPSLSLVAPPRTPSRRLGTPARFTNVPRLAERNPLRFWQGVSAVLALLCIILALQLAN